MSETTAVMEKKPSTTRRKQQEAPEVTATLANLSGITATLANLSGITAMTKGEPEVIHEEDSGITIYNY